MAQTLAFSTTNQQTVALYWWSITPNEAMKPYTEGIWPKTVKQVCHCPLSDPERSSPMTTNCRLTYVDILDGVLNCRDPFISRKSHYRNHSYTHQRPSTNPVNQCDKLLRWSVSETYRPHITSAMKLSCSPLFREINTLCHLIRI